MNKKLVIIATVILAIDILLLLIYGKQYSKFLIFDPFFYAHDVVLFGLTLICLPNNKFVYRVKSVEYFFALAFLYLFYSFYSLNFNNLYIILRQFALFGYGILIYIILNRIYNFKIFNKGLIDFVIYFGILCFIVQLSQLGNLIINKGVNPFFKHEVYSPIIFFGLLILTSSILVFIKNNYLKHILNVFVFVIATTTGHDSMYLAILCIYILYLFLIFSKNKRILLVVLVLIILISVFLFAPSFSDENMQWRLLYWKELIINALNNYLILGDGFGIQYVSDETITKLDSIYKDFSNPPVFKGEDKYFSAPHNSFITITTHIGFISLFFLIYPLKNIFTNKMALKDGVILFLVLSLIGGITFSFFNVILELPHSSSIFWIIYFSLIFKLLETSELFSKTGEL